MNYKKLFLIALFSALIGCFLAPFVSATQTITDLNTNSPVPLNQTLTITGNYDDTDLNTSVFCKFVIRDENNKVVERLSDERTYSNGDFYAQRVLNEPLYKRGQDYNVSVDCEMVNSTVLFTVDQRESIGHTAEYETRFVFDRGNLDSILFFGIIILGLIGIFSVLFYWYKASKKW